MRNGIKVKRASERLAQNVAKGQLIRSEWLIDRSSTPSAVDWRRQISDRSPSGCPALIAPDGSSSDQELPRFRPPQPPFRDRSVASKSGPHALDSDGPRVIVVMRPLDLTELIKNRFEGFSVLFAFSSDIFNDLPNALLEVRSPLTLAHPRQIGQKGWGD
jgi:hypothetical protein